MSGPYRSAEPEPIVSDETELRAIEWLAARKSRLTSVLSATMMALTAAGGLLWWPLAIRVQFALFGGVASVALSGLIAFVLPVAAAFFASLVVGRLLVRLRAPAWLRRIERELGVPAARIRWVLDGSAPR
jgi:hypothetical protein